MYQNDMGRLFLFRTVMARITNFNRKRTHLQAGFNPDESLPDPGAQSNKQKKRKIETKTFATPKSRPLVWCQPHSN